ncbi:TetR family transcriptional regulator [Nocardioides pacificus]
MPRVAEARTPAEPSSPEQKLRYERMLRAAAHLGAEHGLERVQMHDVAKEAGVAIATLYRYFPSKTHLFASLLNAQVVQLETATIAPRPDQDPADAVLELLTVSSRRLLQRPRLALAMMQSNNAAQAVTNSTFADTSTTFLSVVLRTAGITEPTERDVRLARLIEQSWYGVLISTLNGHTTMEDALTDIAIACRLLLAPISIERGFPFTGIE